MFLTYLMVKSVFWALKMSIIAVVAMAGALCVASIWAFKAIVFAVSFGAVGVSKFRGRSATVSKVRKPRKSLLGSKYTVTTYNATVTTTVPIKAAAGPRDWSPTR